MSRTLWKLNPIATFCAMALLAAICGRTALAEEAASEASLISVLEGDADWYEKQDACRTLRRIGTEKSIPALAALLGDERLSHMARYALEPMAMPEAGKALRDALEQTEGLPKTGVIISLGARRDQQAVSQLTPLLDD